MTNSRFPDNLNRLHKQELFLRGKAIAIIQSEPKLMLHLDVVERTMTLANLVREYPTDDEDIKIIKMLSIRMFNAFGACLKLMSTGYHQNSALVMRDTLETLFLMDLFRTDHAAIERWRFADKKIRCKEFSPAAVRKALDERDGIHAKKREETYRMFSELAAHPNMHSQHMLRPEKNGDIVIGPFMEASTLEAGFSELARLAVQAGEIMDAFLPEEWNPDSVRTSFAWVKKKWIEIFYK